MTLQSVCLLLLLLLFSLSSVHVLVVSAQASSSHILRPIQCVATPGVNETVPALPVNADVACPNHAVDIQYRVGEALNQLTYDKKWVSSETDFKYPDRKWKNHFKGKSTRRLSDLSQKQIHEQLDERRLCICDKRCRRPKGSTHCKVFWCGWCRRRLVYIDNGSISEVVEEVEDEIEDEDELSMIENSSSNDAASVFSGTELTDLAESKLREFATEISDDLSCRWFLENAVCSEG